MKWSSIIFAGFTAILLLLVITWRNRKDKKALINELDNDFMLPKEKEPRI